MHIFVIGFLFLACLGIGLRSRVKSKRKKPKRTLPLISVSKIPLLIPYLDFFYTVYKYRKEGLQLVSDCASKFKDHPIVQIFPWPFKIVIVKDASLSQVRLDIESKKVLASSNPGHLDKAQPMYSYVFTDWFKDGMINSDYGAWVGHRRALNKAFTFNALQSSLQVIDRNSKRLVKTKLFPLCTERNDGGLEVKGKDMHEAFSSTAIETILDFILGTKNNLEEEAKAFIRNYNTFRAINCYRICNPLLLINFIWMLHPKSYQKKKAAKGTYEFIMKVIDLHSSNFKENGSLFKETCKGSEEDDASLGKGSGEICLIERMLASGFSHQEILDEVGTFLAAGHETTELAMNILLFDLALNPEHQDICRKEVDQIFNAQNLQSDFDLKITLDQLSNLKYLERCIMESMRLTPPVPFVGRTMKSSLPLIEDYTLETGEIIYIPIWLIHRDPKYYRNPEKFDPDRFLPEEIKQRPPGTYIPFSFGPRSCIGWKFAMMQMKTEALWLLRYFSFHSTDRRSDVLLHHDLVTKPERPYNIILKRRQNLH